MLKEEGVRKGEDVDLKVSRKVKVLSMNLSSSVTVLQEDDGKNSALSFDDDLGAKTWNQKMLLWTGYPGLKQTLSRSLTLEALNQSLRSSNKYPQDSSYSTDSHGARPIQQPPSQQIGKIGRGPTMNVFGPPVTQTVGPSGYVGMKIFGAKHIS